MRGKLLSAGIVRCKIRIGDYLNVEPMLQYASSEDKMLFFEFLWNNVEGQKHIDHNESVMEN